jgi:signal peptidase I
MTIWQRRTARGLSAAALTVLAFLLITSKVMQAYVISASSMEGSLWVGDHILVNKLAHGGEIERDDLLVFRYPDDERQTFVKRVIGLPGDHIRLIDKQVIRNGRRLVEPYAQHLTGSTDAYRDNFPAAPPTPVVTSRRGLDMLAHDVAGGEVTVPAGSLFVLGDNRENSLDSRYWGFVPIQNVVGRPLLVYWHRLHSGRPEEVAP